MCYGMNCPHENAIGECMCKDGQYDCPNPVIDDGIADLINDLDMLANLGELDLHKVEEKLAENEDLFNGTHYSFRIDKDSQVLSILENEIPHTDIFYE